MTEANHREEYIFSEALKLAESDRDAYLRETCGTDKALRARVDALLKAAVKSEGYLETENEGGFAIARALQQSAPCDEMPGEVVGRYKLLEKIGEGGWGVVWMAEQKEPIKRRLALKLLKLGMDSREVVARFESERQALAMMDHPNIAKIFDGGVAPSGRPFFVMELVRGVPITEFCDREKMSPKSRLQLFISVCQAVQHAHQKGVIHRDIKPSNILVTLNDNEPVPKVIDFGIAKAAQFNLTEKTLFTRFHSFVGTPVYTSPEQMQMSSLDVDTRSDIYSLGVLLYELLSGKQPFSASRLSGMGIDAMRKVISEEDPLRPSAQVNSLNQEDRTLIASKRGVDPERFPRDLKRDLDWIVMKCLEKNRTRRYETVNALSLDIKRYLNNEPVLAREPTQLYRVRKLIDRNRLAFSISLAFAASLVGGSIVIALLGVEAMESERAAQMAARKSGEISEFIKRMYSHVDAQVELQLKGEERTRLLKETLRETIDLAASRLAANSDDAQIELLDILGSMYFRIREYAPAETMFQAQLEKLRESGVQDETQLVRALNHLGAAQGRQGKLNQAENNIREALRIQRGALAIEGQDIARTLVNLSVVQVNKAADSRISNEARHSQLQEAVVSIEQALKIQKESANTSKEEIAASLNELGFILSCQGGEQNLVRAESVIREALTINRELLGESSPAFASSLNLLAIAQVMQLKYKDAVDSYRKVQAIRKGLEDSVATDFLSSHDVSVWEHQNTGEESLAALHDVIAITIHRLEKDSLGVADLYAIQAWSYNQEERYEEAESIARKCLAIREKQPAESWARHHTRSLIGRALLGQREFEMAEKYLNDGYEGVKKHRDELTSEHESRLPECLYYLIELYTNWGKPEEALRWKQEFAEFGISLK